MRRAPGHVLVDPDQQRPPLAQRRVVAGPVRRAIAGGRWLAHAARLTAWIRESFVVRLVQQRPSWPPVEIRRSDARALLSFDCHSSRASGEPGFSAHCMNKRILHRSVIAGGSRLNMAGAYGGTCWRIKRVMRIGWCDPGDCADDRMQRVEPAPLDAPRQGRWWSSARRVVCAVERQVERFVSVP